MPSTKPQILIRTEQDLIDRLDKIAQSQNRSRANLAEKVLSDYVNSYEKNHSYHSINQSLDIDENLKEMLIKALKNELIEDNQKHA